MRFVYRDYPLPNHGEAIPSAEAARCAGEQGKFWEYHDELFENQRDLSSETYERIASEVGLDQGAFDECLDSGRARDEVMADVREGESLGVNATPTFFINGRFLSGAQPFERFREIIEEELAR